MHLQLLVLRELVIGARFTEDSAGGCTRTECSRLTCRAKVRSAFMSASVVSSSPDGRLQVTNPAPVSSQAKMQPSQSAFEELDSNKDEVIDRDKWLQYGQSLVAPLHLSPRQTSLFVLLHLPGFSHNHHTLLTFFYLTLSLRETQNCFQKRLTLEGCRHVALRSSCSKLLSKLIQHPPEAASRRGPIKERACTAS